MSEPKLSVVIPAHNEAKILPAILRALEHQTREPDEIILVDNASTDQTRELLARDFPNVCYIFEPKKGIAYARSAGFTAAHGDIIARLDADTIPVPTWAETILVTFAAKPGVSALSGLYAIAELSPHARFWGKAIVKLFRWQHEASLKFSPFLYGGNFALRADTWRAVRSLIHDDNPRVNEDLDLTLALRHIGAQMYFAPAMLAKTKLLRSLNIQKIRHYHANDRYTLSLYVNENATLDK